jgi:hypothetical protein
MVWDVDYLVTIVVGEVRKAERLVGWELLAPI